VNLKNQSRIRYFMFISLSILDVERDKIKDPISCSAKSVVAGINGMCKASLGRAGSLKSCYFREN
jgi:hypothetical protein